MDYRLRGIDEDINGFGCSAAMTVDARAWKLQG